MEGWPGARHDVDSRPKARIVILTKESWYKMATCVGEQAETFKFKFKFKLKIKIT
jgi:hypothetical protein